jgi:hypothetical protein
MSDALETAERGGFAALQVVNVHELEAGERWSVHRDLAARDGERWIYNFFFDVTPRRLVAAGH